MNIKEQVEKNLNTVKELRRLLHENAELANHEHKTQGIILGFFKELGIPTKTLADTGVSATLNEGEITFSEGDNCIAIRADIDALPVNGIFHACGHDFHMAITAGTALVLKNLGYEKAVKFIFQPAEENEGGAERMIAEGVLENPKVTNVVGFHVWPNVKVGTIEVSSGPSMGSVDDFYVTFKGKGGHAAMPHLCKNPLYPAMDFIQTTNFKSRIEADPLNNHVITFSSVQCGNAPNIISDECRVLGTVRTFDSELRQKIREDIYLTTATSAEKYGCTVDVNYKWQYPPVISDDAFTEKFIDTAKALIGEANVLPLQKTFAAEDFAFFAEAVPSVHFRLGIANETQGLHPLHSPHFDASEDAIFYGIYILTNFILSLE